MSQFWSPIVHTLTPYVPGEQPKVNNLIKLNTNENPYGPSPKVLDILKAQADDRLRLYPDPNASDLKEAFAKYHNIKTEQVFVGNGSDEVLAHAFLGLLKKHKPLLFPDISYSFYPVYCGLYEIDYQTIPLNEQFEIQAKDYAIENGGIIFPNPNAPTGRVLALSKIEEVLKSNTQSVVVVDEAYIDFGGETAIALIDKYPNLLVTQTLSKSRSLAGLRVGFAVGHPDLIEGLERVKNSFNSYPLDRFAIHGAVAAYEDQAYFENCCEKIISSREHLIKEMNTLGFETIPSSANFIFTKHKSKQASEIASYLRDQSIIVRYFNKPRIDNYLRITIGSDDECKALIEALKASL
ncbi:MAG: histidinol-phosphate aminotransferase [Oleiphilaceae bacterium]|jgi:histidinol-phosphate aminotransferase